MFTVTSTCCAPLARPAVLLFTSDERKLQFGGPSVGTWINKLEILVTTLYMKLCTVLEGIFMYLAHACET